MLIAGLQKISLIDYPDKSTAVVFTGGCNFNCFYCHNRELINQSKIPQKMIIAEEEVFDFLKKRINKLEAVTITGGEPTIHKDLLEFIKKIKELGFLVKLDSNGTNPKMLGKLIKEGLVDYVAMDIKAPLNWDDYKKVVGINNKIMFDKVLESVEILKENSISYEFRTSMVDGLFTVFDIERIVKKIKNNYTYYLQNFVNPNKKILDEEYKILYNKLRPLKKNDLRELAKKSQSLGQKTKIR